MKAVFKRELRALLCGLRCWGYAVIVLLSAAASVLLNNLFGGLVHFEVNIQYIALGMIPATVLAAADAFHAERRQNTERLLYSLPLKNYDIVLGKWLALMMPVLIAAVGLCVFPVLLAQFGEVPMAQAYVSILALVVLGMAMMGMGLFLSACTRNTALAVIATAVVLTLSWLSPLAAKVVVNVFTLNWGLMLALMIIAFALAYWLSGNGYIAIAVAAAVEMPTLLHYLRGTGYEFMDALGGAIKALNLFEGLSSFADGLLDGGALIGWLCVSALFGFLTVLCIGNRRQAKRRGL